METPGQFWVEINTQFSARARNAAALIGSASAIPDTPVRNAERVRERRAPEEGRRIWARDAPSRSFGVLAFGAFGDRNPDTFGAGERPKMKVDQRVRGFEDPVISGLG